MSIPKSLTPAQLGPILLKNHIVMAPMTRSRAIQNIPNDLMATYYGQRASAGLIVTEGVSSSPNGLGYARMPGIFNEEQVAGWKLVTAAVHQRGGKIFAQLAHTGRVGHVHNIPKGGRILAPSAVGMRGQMWTDLEGMKDFPVPLEMTVAEIEEVKQEFVYSARNAIKAGFDGVELDGGNGYLLEQFLSPHSNRRTDDYGGSVANRTRFVLEVTEAVRNAVGKDKTGVRLSPYGVSNDMPLYDEIDATYTHLALRLNELDVLYIHLADHSSGRVPGVPVRIKNAIRSAFKNALIMAGGYTLATAESDIESGMADLVAFGKPFISNPDLIDRFHKKLPLHITLDASTFYTPGPKGLIDYPLFEEELVSA